MQGLLLHAIVHSAGVQDRDGGISLLATLFGQFPFLAKLFADSAYAGSIFHTALAKILPSLKTEIVKRSDQARAAGAGQSSHLLLAGDRQGAQPAPPPTPASEEAKAFPFKSTSDATAEIGIAKFGMYTKEGGALDQKCRRRSSHDRRHAQGCRPHHQRHLRACHAIDRPVFA